MLAAICGDMANAMIYMQIQKTVKMAPVPRHREIKESLCKLIRKQLGVE
jgi:hypothetical protein